MAAALRAGRSILGISQAAFAREMRISKSKLARAETAAGSISSEDLEFALSFFRQAGVEVSLSMEGDLRITVRNDDLRIIDLAMTQDVSKLVGVDEVVVDVDKSGSITTAPLDESDP